MAVTCLKRLYRFEGFPVPKSNMLHKQASHDVSSKNPSGIYHLCVIQLARRVCQRRVQSCSSTAVAAAAAASGTTTAPTVSSPSGPSQPPAAVRAVNLDPELKAKHKRPEGWLAPGPLPAAVVDPAAAAAVAEEGQLALDPSLCPGNNETLSYLTGDWRIFQLRNGHRWSMDDMMTAYVALQTLQAAAAGAANTAAAAAAAAAVSTAAAGPSASYTTGAAADPSIAAQTQQQHNPLSPALSHIRHVLDLGCGIGSVLLMVAWGLRRMTMDYQQQQQQQQVQGDREQHIQQHQQQQWQQQQQQWQQSFPITSLGVEAQSISYQLAVRSIQYNLGPGDRVQVLNQDLRQSLPSSVPQSFQLITGTPPYIPPGAGGQSNKPQKGPCCVEIRGGIEDYCKAAAAVLAPGGHFVVCCGLQGQPFKGQRAQRAAAAAGLVIVRQVTIITKEGKPPLFAVYVMQAAGDVLAGAQQQQQQQQQEVGTASNAYSSSSNASDNSSSSSSSSTLEAQVAAGQLARCEELFVVRGADGKHTDAWHEAREVMGLPPLQDWQRVAQVSFILSACALVLKGA